MANRVMNSSDVATRPWAVEGDIMLDSLTGTKTIHYNGISTVPAFFGARLGCTIWIDGDAVGTLQQFRINNTVNATYWAISDANNYVHIRPVPGTQVHVLRNDATNDGYLVEIGHIQYFVIDGETTGYPGLSNRTSTFLRGTFGFFFSNGPDNGGHILLVNTWNVSGGHVVVRGVECEGGFAGLRAFSNQFGTGNPDVEVSLTVTRNYFHDGDSEGVYIGGTHSGPKYLVKNLQIYDNVFARRGTESIQTQHLFTDETRKCYIRNNVVWATASDWLNAFQPYQDSMGQWLLEEGNNYYKDNIFDGLGGSALINMSGNHITTKSSIPAYVLNNFFKSGRDTFSYVHNSNVYGITRVFKRNWLKGFDNSYGHDNLNTPATAYVTANNNTDTFFWSDIKHDGAKAAFFQNPNQTGFQHFNVSNSADVIPDVEYVNSGAHEPATHWMHWKATYGNYHQDPTTDKPVKYNAGWIVSNLEVGIEYAFYKVLVTHTTTGLGALTPRQHIAANGETVYKRLYWDENGVRNDQPGFSGNNYSDFPPDDFRLMADNFWNLKGMGLLSNIPNNGFTQYRWEIADDVVGTNAKLATDPFKLNRIPVPEEIGKYLRCGIRYKNDSGAFDSDFRYTPWMLVTI